MDEELVEAVARMIDPDAWHDKLPQDGLATWWMDRREKAREKARAVIPIVQEHDAKVAEGERLEEPQPGTSDDAYEQAITDAAAAIRGKA